MVRLIDADVLMPGAKYKGRYDVVTAYDIANAPTIDPVKHGRWVEENTRTHSMQFKCSECGRIAYYPQNHHSTEPKRCGYAYCPHCGADMRGEAE